MNRVEAVVDAIGKTNGIHDPDSDCYKLRNPLLIRSFARAGKHEVDELGRRVFASLLAGYKAALYDVELKLKGASRAGLKSTDAFYRLLGVYGIHEPGGVSNIVSFLRRALHDQSITKDTELSYFLESSNG